MPRCNWWPALSTLFCECYKVITEIYISTAAATGNVRELRRLGSLEGANVNGTDERGRTPAHISVEEGQLTSLKVCHPK